jgi:hypothetical protein
MTPRSLSESHRHTLQEFPAASALLCNLNLDGALQVLEIHIERTDDESSHLQICVCGVRGMDAEHWATERSDSSVLSIHLADSLLWFGALRCEIGIGGHLAMPLLPHHRTYGARIRRFG